MKKKKKKKNKKKKKKKKKKKSKPLVNVGNSCAINALLQVIARLQSFDNEQPPLDKDNTASAFCIYDVVQSIRQRDAAAPSLNTLEKLRDQIYKYKNWKCGKQQDADDVWNAFRCLMGGVLDLHFELKLVQTITAQACKTVSESSWKEAVLLLSWRGEKGVDKIGDVTVDSDFVNDKANTYTCDCNICAGRKGAFTQTNRRTVAAHTNYVYVCAKRFSHTAACGTTKICTPIHLERRIQLQRDDGALVQFSLAFVVHHRGSTLAEGHYVCQDLTAGVIYNDGHLEHTDDVDLSTAYMLFYSRE
jgi:ubiquitin C-terminal hydrolase